MKLFNLLRGNGKTMRMIYASEFNNVPILCHTEHSKKVIIDMAERYKIDIPTPLTIDEFIVLRGKEINHKKNATEVDFKILIDEMDSVLLSLLRRAFGCEIIGATMTVNTKQKL